ncbi:MAG TPA: zinc ribbon domain-containing protein [Desulfomonilia bacterium]
MVRIETEERDNRIMICPNCGAEQADGLSECTGCGIIFAKYKKRVKSPADKERPEESPVRSRLAQSVLQGMFTIPSNFMTLRIILLAGLFLLGFRLAFIPLSDPQSETSFLLNTMHAINLVFHEAGHLLLSFMGEFITVLGGTLMQLTVPMVFTVYFISWRQDSFAAAATFWWFGENFIDIAPYIYDALDLNLMLLGGHTGKEGPHDWEYILGTLGLLDSSHAIGWMAWGTGCLIMLAATAWGGFLVYRQYRST